MSPCLGSTGWTYAAVLWAQPGALTVKNVPELAPVSTRPSAQGGQALPTEEMCSQADPSTKVREQLISRGAGLFFAADILTGPSP